MDNKIIKCPSGDEYTIKVITVREKNKCKSLAIKNTIVKNDEGKSVVESSQDTYKYFEELVLKSVIKAPWNEKESRLIEDDLDKIKLIDWDMLATEVFNLNHPEIEKEEKLGGQ